VVLGAVTLLLSVGETADQSVLRRLLLGGLALSAVWVAIMGLDLLRALRLVSDSTPESGEPGPETPPPGDLIDRGTAASRGKRDTPEEFDRQVETIDSLQHDEEDPDRLQQLFKLDQSVARLRRAARGLATLSDSPLADYQAPAESEAGVALLDVLTSALGSVEHFERVRIGAVADVICSVEVAEDLSHLVAELLDVGVRHSPANRAVEVAAGHSNQGDKLLVQVLDGGEAKAKRLKQTNHLFANPLQPLDDPEHVGLAIASRLALRVRGSLIAERGRQGRTLTTVALDPALFVDRPSEQQPPLGPGVAAPEVPPVDGGSTRPSMLDRLKRKPESPEPPNDPANSRTPDPTAHRSPDPPFEPDPADRGPEAGPPQSLQEALGRPENIDAGLEALLGEPPVDSQGSVPPTPPQHPVDDGPPTAPSDAAPYHSSETSDPDTESDRSTETGVDGDEPAVPHADPDRLDPSMRRPNDVRSRLSRYRKGLDAGRTGNRRPPGEQHDDSASDDAEAGPKYPKPQRRGHRGPSTGQPPGSGPASDQDPDTRSGEKP
jgi:hypothetical protein